MNTTLQDIVVRELTDEVKISNLERERETTMQNKQFQKWLKEMHIGSRIEVKDKRAEAINVQYDFRKLNNEGHYWMPEWVRDLYR